MDNNLHSGHRANARKKFIENGFSKSTPPHEILEMLLFYSIPRCDTNKTAHLLIERFGSLSGVFKADIEDLKTVEGIGENSAVLIKLIPAIARAYSADAMSFSDKLTTLEEIGLYAMTRFAGITEEQFAVISLSGSGKFLSFDIIARGDIQAVGVSTRKVIEVLIRTRATTVVLAHNHPSGLALPSGSDLTFTKTLKQALDSIGVHLQDHIIVADGDFVSLASSERFTNLFE